MIIEIMHYVIIGALLVITFVQRRTIGKYISANATMMSTNETIKKLADRNIDMYKLVSEDLMESKDDLLAYKRHNGNLIEERRDMTIAHNLQVDALKTENNLLRNVLNPSDSKAVPKPRKAVPAIATDPIVTESVEMLDMGTGIASEPLTTGLVGEYVDPNIRKKMINLITTKFPYDETEFQTLSIEDLSKGIEDHEANQ